MDNIKKKYIRRIGIDARFYGPIGKGLGRYTQEVVDSVLKLDTSASSAQVANEYVIFLRKENYNTFKSSNPRAKKVLTEIRWYSFTEQLLMPFYIWKERLDLMHFPHFNVPIFCPTKFIITIHDLILTKFPTTRATTLGPALYKMKNLLYKIVIWLGVKRAKKLIAVSEFTKNDIIKHFKVNENKVVVTHEGVASLSRTDEEINEAQMMDSYKIKNNFLLYVGNAYPHKNLEGLVKVFNKIKNDNLNLVLVGKEDYFYKRIMDYAENLGLWTEGGQNNKVIFSGYVPDQELKVLYKKAVAYIFPSLYEGFGLPPLEAMANGCPVVSSNKTSMPEILGNAALYFNPENENEMREQIKEIISNEDLRASLIKKGYERIKMFSWTDCAEKTLGVYNNI